MTRRLSGAYRAALWLSLATPFALTHAATRSLESSPGSGFVISADYQDLSPGLPVVLNGSRFTLNRPTDKEESALLEFLTEKGRSESARAVNTVLMARMKWGDFTLFKLAFRSKGGDTSVTIPVRCATSCVASLSQEEIPGVAEPEFPLSTFAYFEEERARQIAGELARARSFPVMLNVFPDNSAPSTPYPFTFRVDVRLAFAARSPPPVYDFSSQSWRGKVLSNEAEWQALARFLVGLRNAGPAGVGHYMNEAFGNDAGQYFLYTVNEFESRNGVSIVTSPMLEPEAFATKVAAWPAIVPLGTVRDGAAVRLLFSTSAQIDDVQQMPIRCAAGGCRVVDMDWVSYVHTAIQRPALLKLYRSMFQEALPPRPVQK